MQFACQVVYLHFGISESEPKQMCRKKRVSLKQLPDVNSRNAYLSKRKIGLFSKAFELGKLCSCDVAVVIRTDQGRFHTFSYPATSGDCCWGHWQKIEMNGGRGKGAVCNACYLLYITNWITTRQIRHARKQLWEGKIMITGRLVLHIILLLSQFMLLELKCFITSRILVYDA